MIPTQEIIRHAASVSPPIATIAKTEGTNVNNYITSI